MNIASKCWMNEFVRQTKVPQCPLSLLASRLSIRYLHSVSGGYLLAYTRWLFICTIVLTTGKYFTPKCARWRNVRSRNGGVLQEVIEICIHTLSDDQEITKIVLQLYLHWCRLQLWMTNFEEKLPSPISSHTISLKRGGQWLKKIPPIRIIPSSCPAQSPLQKLPLVITQPMNRRVLRQAKWRIVCEYITLRVPTPRADFLKCPLDGVSFNPSLASSLVSNVLKEFHSLPFLSVHVSVLWSGALKS